MKKLLVIIPILAIAGLVGFRLYGELTSSEASPGDRQFMQRPAMLVGTAEAQLQYFQSNLEILGELAPLASVDVMSRVSGRLKESLVERGDTVRKGQLLAVVDDEDLLQQIRRAEASIEVARAAVNREQASLDNLEIQVRRLQELHTDALISTQDLEDAESRLRVAAAQLELAKAQVSQAEAALKELKIQREYTLVYSPLDGFVGSRNLDPGALVNPNLPITRVIDVSRVKTVVPVSEVVLSQIKPGLSAQVRVDAYPSRLYSGRIVRISPFLNPETRTADIEIEIANEAGELKPGMFARVTIEAQRPQPRLAIPRSALLTRGDSKGVFLLDDELVTHFLEIRIGRIQGDYVEVLEGLDEGVTVVTNGVQKLNEGDKVKIG
ncbi:MAG: efflux RND transporter periplasmic adaptor subunit [Acidobacteriota bacterium]|nr:MAG: efflux RND transporter periplasmic adaptor subunit [Acidobacteriota bacterium]